jgi:hypothetical protein
MGPRRTAALTALTALAALAIWAAPAQATFHLMKIREVYPGSAAAPAAQYVELQMWSSGQNLVAEHLLRTYTAAGAQTKIFLPHDVAGGANQSTVLIATPQAETQFGVTADAELPAGLEPAGGAVCWEEIDCVSWGSFAGTTAAAAGSPAPAIPDGMALRRKSTPGCATLLEPEDDTNNSSVDFEAVFPAPRPNSVAPTEHACSVGGGPGGGGGKPAAPQTLLKGKPAKKGRDRTPTFRFASDMASASFECKLDGKSFRACRSPFTTRRLGRGPHLFSVRAVLGDADLVDPSPATFGFKILKLHRHRHRG